MAAPPNNCLRDEASLIYGLIWSGLSGVGEWARTVAARKIIGGIGGP